MNFTLAIVSWAEVTLRNMILSKCKVWIVLMLGIFLLAMPSTGEPVSVTMESISEESFSRELFSSCIMTSDANGTAQIQLFIGVPVQCIIPPLFSVQLFAVLSVDTAAVLLQFHTLKQPLTLTSRNERNFNELANGSHVGMISYIAWGQQRVNWMLVSNHKEEYTEVMLFVQSLDKDDPVSGGCNMEFVLENDPNIYFTPNPTYDITNVKFAPANRGSSKGLSPDRCDKRFDLVYDIYMQYFSLKDVNNETYFRAVENMMRLEYIRSKALFVKTIKEDELTEVFLMIYKGRGISYNVIVTDTYKNRSVAYAPFLDYACDFRNGSVCLFTDIGPMMIYTFSALLGIILCFFGHWIFLFETYMFGFLPSSIGLYMMFGAISSLPSYGLMTVSIALALIFGLCFMMLWWRFACIIPTILWISVCLGFLFASCLFFTPFGNLPIWQNHAAFGLSFTCGVLLVPIFGLPSSKWASYVACAIIGSYMTISAVSFTFGGVMHYIVLNVIHRAYIPNFDKALSVCQLNVADCVCMILWILMAVLGIISQWRLNKNLPDFPPHPYKRWKAERARRRLQATRPQNNHVSITSGVVNPNENQHNSLLEGGGRHSYGSINSSDTDAHITTN